MKTDISKLSFDEWKHYLGVFDQMGRVYLDSDTNEHTEMWLRLLRRQANDTIETGSPNHGFRVDDRILLEAMDSSEGWTAEAAAGAPALFVDYFEHSVGEGSLVVEGAEDLVRQVDPPLDLSELREVVFAVRGAFAANECVFFLGQGGTREDLTTTEDADEVDGWRIFRADPATLPAAFDLSNVEEYGFTDLNSAQLYAFDAIKIDHPIRSVLVATAHADPFETTPLNPGDEPQVVINDDDRIWRSTVLEVTDAGSVRYTLPRRRNLENVRQLVFAARSSTVGAVFHLRLIDEADLTLDLPPVAVAAADTWQIASATLTPGVIDLTRVEALEWRALTASDYLFSPILIEMDLAGNLVIQGGDGTSDGAGRFYGDGFAAIKEQHETYFSQKDLPEADPAPLAPPVIDTARMDLAYLDLWERPITYMEDPEIREVALEGADTRTRTQLVGQVRLLMGEPVPLGQDPQPPQDEFDALPRCGSGTLTTKDNPNAVLDPCADPCEPEIAGTFVGEENRLYRVEVFTCGDIGPEGAPGTATFTWSKENAATACPLIEDGAVGALSVRVEKPELFREGDLIEVGDDRADLITGPFEDTVNHRCHIRGELRRITAINLEDKRVSWEDALAADPQFHAGLNENYRLGYHAKLRHWDNVLPATAGDIVLEDGVVIELGGEQMVPGDFWVFTSRVVDHSVERLIEEPPRGICHRYFKLAFLTRFNDNGTLGLVVEDCRPTFNPLTALQATDVAFDPERCALQDPAWESVENVQEAIELLCQAAGGPGHCVTVGDGVVSVGEHLSIQAAIDALGGHGGIVCILPGNHLVTQRVDVPSDVVLQGAGAATRILFLPQNDTGPLFRLAGSDRVRFENFFAITPSGASLILARSSTELRMRSLTLVNTGMSPFEQLDAQGSDPGTAVTLEGQVRSVSIEDSRLIADVALRAVGTCSQLRLTHSELRAPYACLLFDDVEDVQVLSCTLAGLDDENLQRLHGLDLGAANADLMQAAQDTVYDALHQSEGACLLGYFATHATLVAFKETRIFALAGLVPFVGLRHVVEDCLIVGLINIALVNSTVFSLGRSTLLGLVNVVHAGGVATGVDIHHSQLLGLYSLAFTSLEQAQPPLTKAFVAAMTNADEVPSDHFVGMNQDQISARIDELVQETQTNQLFGAVTALTCRDNLFLSFLTAVQVERDSIAGDIAIAGNHVYLCLEHGVLLDSGPQFLPGGGLEFDPAPGVNVVHNHFRVAGIAVSSQVPDSLIEGNQIMTSGEAGIEVRGWRSQAKSNSVLLFRLSPDQEGGRHGILVAPGTAHIEVSANRIGGGAGNGILIQGTTTELSIEDNQVEQMELNGITVAQSANLSIVLTIRGNRVRNCARSRLDVYPVFAAGGIVVADGTRVTLTDNLVSHNGRFRPDRVYGIYAEDLAESVINNNRVWENGGPGPSNPVLLEGGGLYLHNARQDIQVLGNSVRDNRGYGLHIGESSRGGTFDPNDLITAGDPPPTVGVGSDFFLRASSPWTVALADIFDNFAIATPGGTQTATVSGNTVEGSAEQHVVRIDDVERLVFNDNRVQGVAPQSPDIQVVYTVWIQAHHLIFNGNHVEGPGHAPGTAVVPIGGDHRLVLTDNILRSSIAMPADNFPLVVNAHNLPF